MLYKEFCEEIGIEKIEGEAEKVYIEAEESGELKKMPPVAGITKMFSRTLDEVHEAAKVISEKNIYLRYMKLCENIV